MSKKEQAALKQNAQEFVRRVITEMYGQNATKKVVNTTARRVIDTLPVAYAGVNLSDSDDCPADAGR